MVNTALIPHHTQGCQVDSIGENSWRLTCPGGGAGRYRLAQLDDYYHVKRSCLPWSAPCHLQLEARASANHLPGTWGFGFWNDPFGMNLGFGGVRLLPALPDAAWFFFASAPNYLSFRNDLPAVGALAAVFRASAVPIGFLAPGVLAAPLLLMRWFSRLARRLASALIREDAARLSVDLTAWHTYEVNWKTDGVQFLIDGAVVHQSELSPRGPLGLVLWLDNQYAAWNPDGRLKYGTLETDPRWIEIRNLTVV